MVKLDKDKMKALRKKLMKDGALEKATQLWREHTLKPFIPHHSTPEEVQANIAKAMLAGERFALTGRRGGKAELQRVILDLMEEVDGVKVLTRTELDKVGLKGTPPNFVMVKFVHPIQLIKPAPIAMLGRHVCFGDDLHRHLASQDRVCWTISEILEYVKFELIIWFYVTVSRLRFLI